MASGILDWVKIEVRRAVDAQGEAWDRVQRLFSRILPTLGPKSRRSSKRACEKISSGGIGRDLKHFREGGAGAGIIFGLDVGHAENIGGVDVGAGIQDWTFSR